MQFKIKRLFVLFISVYFVLLVMTISPLKIFSAAAEIRQPILSLPHKHTYLSSHPSTQVKKSGVVVHTGNPSAGEMEMGIPQGWLASQPLLTRRDSGQ